MQSLKVASFNINSVRARLSIVIDWLDREAPDVVCLQETKVEDVNFPVSAFEQNHFHAFFRGEKTYNGVAFICRDVPEEVRIGFDENESEGTRIIAATMNGIHFVNTYVPQGFHPLSKQFRYKLKWLKRLYEYFDCRFDSHTPVMWLGDFNIAPEPRDVYAPDELCDQVGFHHEEHAALEKFKEWGFVDVFRMHQHQSEQYTFWDYRVRNAYKRKIGWRIDHIWATRHLAEKSVSAWINDEERLREKPSDHAPIVAEFRV